MQLSDNWQEHYHATLQINGPHIFYGDINYSKIFSDNVLMESLILNSSAEIIKNIQTYGGLTEQEKLILGKIQFYCELSTSLTAKAEKVNGIYKIKLSSGIIRFLGLLNGIMISHYDSLYGIDMKSKELFKNNIKNYGQALFDSFNYLHDKKSMYKHLEIKIPFPNKNTGFFSSFKEKINRELDPIYGSTNHQLEFIILHEIAHILYPKYNELECDTFALKISRNIWKQISYHTSVCEFFQLVLFIYYDFHEKYFEVQESLMKGWNNLHKHFLKFKTNEFNHTRASERFLNILNNLENISEKCKSLLSFSEILFDSTFDALLRKELEFIHFFNIANIEKQLRIQTYLHTKFDFENSKGVAKLMKEKINAVINTTDTEFWSKYNELDSPFRLYFIGNKLTSDEIFESNTKKVYNNFDKFHKAVGQKFGVFDKEKANTEESKYYIILNADKKVIS